jgi:hypothetical protein
MEQRALKPSRRNLLVGLGGAAIAAMVALPLVRSTGSDRARRILAANPLTRRFVSLVHAEQDEWTAQVGATFAAVGGYRLRLAGVEPLPSAGDRPAEVTRQSAFLAVFDVLDGKSMAGDLIYAVSHPEYGAMPLFLSASARPGRMVALFN